MRMCKPQSELSWHVGLDSSSSSPIARNSLQRRNSKDSVLKIKPMVKEKLKVEIFVNEIAFYLYLLQGLWALNCVKNHWNLMPSESQTETFGHNSQIFNNPSSDLIHIIDPITGLSFDHPHIKWGSLLF